MACSTTSQANQVGSLYNTYHGCHGLSLITMPLPSGLRVVINWPLRY